MIDPTIETSIWKALEARVQTLPTSIVPQTSIYYPKKSFAKPSDSVGTLPYIEVRQLPNQNTRVMINAGKHRRMGILQLDYLEPLHRALTIEQTLQQAGLIAEHFPQDLWMRSGGVSVRVEQAPDVGRGLEDGGYWRIPISVRYDCFA